VGQKVKGKKRGKFEANEGIGFRDQGRTEKEGHKRGGQTLTGKFKGVHKTKRGITCDRS